MYHKPYLQMESVGSLTTDVAVRALRPFKLDFGTHPVMGRPCVVSIEVSNVTDVPVHWELSSSESSGLEMENWVEPGRPRNEAEKAMDFIRVSNDTLKWPAHVFLELPFCRLCKKTALLHISIPSICLSQEHKIFEAMPNSGVIEAKGGRTTLTLTYRPSHTGNHMLPVFLRIKDGKRLQLQLVGSTVPDSVQRLFSTPAQRTLTFQPTPIGEVSPPLHTHLLRNGGPGEIRYSLDLSQLRQLTQDSWGFEVRQGLQLLLRWPERLTLKYPDVLSYGLSLTLTVKF